MSTVTDRRGATRRLRVVLLASTALVMTSALPAMGPARAQDATWLANPGTADLNTGTNWSTGSVPTGTAYFDATSTSSLSFSSGTTTIGGWTFNAGASNYSITNNYTLAFTGAGIAVNGGSVTFNNYNDLSFSNGSTAGNATINNNNYLQFFGSSTAGTATITNNVDLGFNDASTAGSATITNNYSLNFNDTSTAGSATITNNGNLYFRTLGTAGNAALINNAGGTVDFSNSTGPNGDGRLSAGSIAGAGNYILGANELTVGSNNLSTEVSGVISGTGSLVKVGTGTLTLSGANTYTGGTTISGFGSELWLGNTTGGVGSILGTVTVGSGSSFKIVNADTSGITTITNNGFTFFYNATSAGSANITNNHTLQFFNTSTAGSATITNNANLNFYGSAGNAAITNNYVLTFNNTATAGSATITSSDSSSAVFVYFYDNSTAGSATITNGNNSYLNFFGNSTAGSASFTNNSYMYFKDSSTADNATIDNNSTIFFYNNSTAGNAKITNNAGGRTYFYENSTAGNAQLINNAANAVFDFSYGTGPNGDNKLSAGSIAGDGTFSLGANELTVGSNNLSTTVSGVIADGGANGGTGGSLVKTGTGTLTLSGTNTYTGGTTFAGGTVSVSSDANLGDAAGGLTFNGGALRVTGTAFTSTARTITLGTGGGTFDITNAGNTFTVSQALTGSGGLTKAGAGTLTLSGAHTYTGATTVNAGNLTIEGSIASSTVNNNNARLVYANSATAGSAAITNTGILHFLGTSTAGNAAINNDFGILQFYNASTAGNAVISNGDFGGIDFYGGSTAGSATITNSNSLGFFDNSTAGNAAIANNAGGTVNFSNSTGPNGDNKLSAGSIAGAGNFILGANELTVGSNNLSTEVSGVISGSGSLTKTGTGKLTLSGTNTYTGATTVNGGTLAVNGSILASSGVTVNSGSTLGGTGTVGNTAIASGGALAPGNSIGTLTVNGNLTFNAGGLYTVEVSPTAADRTNVTGTATLTGATVQAIALAGSFHQQTYTILTATGGLGGTQFAGITGSSFAPGARNPHLTYDANNVFLVLDPGTIQLPAGARGNEASVAGGINKAVESGATPPAAFDALLNMTGAQLTNALNQVSGQPATGGATSGTQMTSSFLTLLLNPNGGAVGGTTFGGARSLASEPAVSLEAAAAYAAVTPKDKALSAFAEPRWSVWGQVYGGYNKTEGDSADTTARTWGLATGFDYRAAPDLTFGFALAGGSMNWSLSDGLGGGKSEVMQLGAYGRKEFGPAYLSAALSYAWHNMSTDRTVTVSGTDKLIANFAAHSFGGRIETGTRFATPWVGVTPYAALQVQNFRTPSYSESAVSGSNAFALTYDANSTTTTRTELGAWFDNTIALDRGNVLALRSRAAWANDHSSDTGMDAVFRTLPGSNFTVNGAQTAPNSLLTSVGAELRLANSWSIGGRFDGEFASGSQTYAGTGSVRYAW